MANTHQRSVPLWVPVMQTLLERIVSGRLEPLSLLPNEAELGHEFNVSRTVIREAVKVLTEKGLVRTQRGRGTTVAASGDWRAFDPDVLEARLRSADAQTVINELFVIRKAIEPELAALAAAVADDRALARLAVRFDALERSLTEIDAYAAADAEFHDAIAEMAGNGLARDMLGLIAGPIASARERTIRLPNALETAHIQHLEIFSCIRARDGAGAAEAMTNHMLWNQERLPSQTVMSDDR